MIFQKILVFLFTLFALFLITLSILGRNIIIFKSEPRSVADDENNSPLEVLSSCDFSTGSWCAYIFLPAEDQIGENWPLSRKLYYTNDLRLLNTMKATWAGKCVGTDMATVQSKILLFRDKELVYQSGIVLKEGYEGLQTPQCGWLEIENSDVIRESCVQFEPMLWPIVRL